MQKHKFCVLFPDTLFMGCASRPPEHLGRTKMH
jgi:hypothetical protein